MNRALLMAALAASACACGPKAPAPASSGGGAPAGARAAATAPIAVTSRMDGSVSIVERDKLTLVRTIEAASPGASSTWPMLALADPARSVFYVGNVNGALARIPFGEGAPGSLDLGAPQAGMSLSPDGKLLAVSGVKDLTLRLVDPVAFKEIAKVSLGNAADAPKRKPLTFGVASPHPVWLADGSGVVAQDNVHEELVLVGRDGAIKARRGMRSAVHDVIVAKDGTLLALGEGAADVPAHIAVLTPALAPVREVEVPLANGESAKLHHGALSPDGELLVVANMGPIAEASGFTAAAIRWKTGEVAWTAPTVRTAGHVAFLGADRVLVLGHRTAEIKLLEAATGKEVATWEVMGTPSLGHALEPQPDGSVLVLDGTLGRIMRFKDGELIAESERVGDGYAESSLSE